MTDGTLCRTVIVYPVLSNRFSHNDSSGERSPEAGLEEVCSLAEAVDLDIVHSEIVKLTEIRPSTYVGKGRLEELSSIVKMFDASLVVFNCQITPMQQRNLEKILNVKVIDRTALILEIFGERASTREGVLQVELAHLTYQKSRLVRSWTHLERQRGGAGFLGGPGEKQIEMDRRIIGEKIIRIKKDLEKVKRTRSLHRKSRQKVPYPVIALVGYTNAGKSTLFNRITGASVYAEDKLFATLDPTMRQIRLPGGTKVIISDTVGFISELPTELVAAFRATLEEVIEADIILHVRDVSHPDTAVQKKDVLNVLRGLGLKDKIENNLIEVQNKIDLLSQQEADEFISCDKRGEQAAVSALCGRGIDGLLSKIEDKLCSGYSQITITLRPEDGKTMAWLYRNSEVVGREDKDNFINLHIKISSDKAEHLKALIRECNKC